MIETLRIENVAILEQGELEFGPGLNVLTGETGAGKSVVLGALALLAGARASSDAIRDGADEALVEACFDTKEFPALEAQLVERGVEIEEHQLIVQRTLARSGRNRARLGGSLLPVGVLAEILHGRLEISSQHDSQALLRPDEHGLLLDRSGGLLERRAEVAGAHARLRAIDEELVRLRAGADALERQREFLGFQLREIDEAQLDVAAFHALEAERSRLVHAERLGSEGGRALALIVGESFDGDAAGAADRVAEAGKRLAALAPLDPTLDGPARRIAGLADELRELALEVERQLDSIEADPRRLERLDERLAQVSALERKYGGSIEAVLETRERIAAELQSLAAAPQRAGELGAERALWRERLVEAAQALSAGRRASAQRLAREVEGRLRELGMPEARFEVALHELSAPEGLPCGPSGNEAPEFLFSANAGEALRSFRKVVSGGELSRAFLALKGALRDRSAGMVLVFDEVDAGIGGEAADRVGRSLAELAEAHQVLCITHLPQVAAFADRHFRVAKRSRSGRTQVAIERIDGEERVREIARMAGGEKIGSATLAHAREMLAARARAGRAVPGTAARKNPPVKTKG